MVGSSLDKSSSSPKAFPSVQTLVLAQIVWAVLALLFFLLFSVSLPGEDRPQWYAIGTTVFEEVAYLTAAWLCFRNWRSPQIVSGRNVWLCIGLGVSFYFLGGLLFFYWETVLGQDAAVSPGDFFYILTYIFLILGIILAVSSRRLSLEMWQWGVVAIIAAISIVIAWFVSSPPAGGNVTQSLLIQPVAAQTAPATRPTTKPVVKASPKVAPAAKPKPAAVASPVTPPAVAPVPAAADKNALTVEAATPTAPAALAAPKVEPPGWVKSLENVLDPLKSYVNGFYIVCDVLLLILATTLLLAFWGGRFAQSWRMIAAAAFSLYIADIWFKYTTTYIPNYQSGGFLEVFWVFSGVLFGIGAALEHDLSSRARSRSSGRRRASL
ncbi:hypothetical protein H6F86_12675 [Phormidium sp. FACHB-592]|nr:hypothetical protein [Phormidium sp. FACHB-592]